MVRKKGWGYQPPPRSRAKEVAARTGVVERLTGVARQKAESIGDNEPLPDASRPLTLAEKTALARQTLPTGVDLDAEIARRKEAALAKPNSPQFVEHLMTGLGLSELAARVYALALRATEAPEVRPTQVVNADPRTGRTSDRITVTVPTTGPGGPPIGWGVYQPAQLPAQAILGLPPNARLIGTQYAEAARIMQAAHAELETAGLLEWSHRGSRGLLRL
jgi:hypothetical protein